MAITTKSPSPQSTKAKHIVYFHVDLKNRHLLDLWFTANRSILLSPALFRVLDSIYALIFTINYGVVSLFSYIGFFRAPTFPALWSANGLTIALPQMTLLFIIAVIPRNAEIAMCEQSSPLLHGTRGRRRPFQLLLSVEEAVVSVITKGIQIIFQLTLMDIQWTVFSFCSWIIFPAIAYIVSTKNEGIEFFLTHLLNCSFLCLFEQE